MSRPSNDWSPWICLGSLAVGLFLVAPAALATSKCCSSSTSCAQAPTSKITCSVTDGTCYRCNSVSWVSLCSGADWTCEVRPPTPNGCGQHQSGNCVPPNCVNWTNDGYECDMPNC